MLYIMFLIFLSFLIFIVILTACEDRTPLGLRNGLIRDDQISASSTLTDDPEFQPYFARLDSPYRWCSVSNEAAGKEYLQVCHKMLLVLSAEYFSIVVENLQVYLIVKIQIFVIQVFLKLCIDCHVITRRVAG